MQIRIPFYISNSLVISILLFAIVSLITYNVYTKFKTIIIIYQLYVQTWTKHNVILAFFLIEFQHLENSLFNNTNNILGRRKCLFWE